MQPGATLNHYEILAAIGKGGMGEVWKARDTKLGREVAIKTLPVEFAQDGDRLARFEREARLLASLNHPGIAAIYGLEEAGPGRFLVLELVDGDTLADRLQRGAIPLEESLKLGVQIAEALEAAHDKGVIHRDLKPANIKVTPEGKVKVLDFGLAKAFASDDSHVNLSNSPTLTMAGTQQGIILGTAAYMSPEQARGKTIDKRTDIWAFGAVMYEMLTGHQPFHGEDVGDILATVVKMEPDWSRLPEDTPATIRTLLTRCLRKDRRQRLGDAGAARIEIEETLAAPAAGPAAKVSIAQRAIPLRIAALVGIVAVGLAIFIGTRLRSPSIPEVRPNAARLSLSLPAGTELGDRPLVAVISPDGSQLAFVARKNGVEQLYIRAMNSFEARPLADTNGAIAPFFSPDGQWLGFFTDGKLKKVSTTGGVVVTLLDTGAGVQGGSWGAKGMIVFRSGNQLAQISADGGAARPITTSIQNSSNGLPMNPEFLPGGEAVLFTSAASDAVTADERSIEVLSIKTGERKVLIRGGHFARYLPTGHVVFLRSGALMAVPFDMDRLDLIGTPVPVIEGLRQTYGGGAFTCSRDGTCVYIGGGLAAQRTVTIVDRATAASQPLPLMAQSYTHPRFSPSGGKIAFWIEQAKCFILVYDIARGVLTRLTSESDNHFPTWTPNGLQITYLSRKDSSLGYEFVSKSVDGSGPEEPLSETPQNLTALSMLNWSPNNLLAFVDRGDIWLFPKSGDGKPQPLFQSKFTETMPIFSPDGHWLAYVSDESGQEEVYVQPFPGPGAKYRISTSGGLEPVWARSGRELFYRHRDQVMVVELNAQPVFNATRPRVLFAGSFAQSSGRYNYEVSPDGQRFVMLNEDERTPIQINVLTNWFSELQQRVPVK